MDYREKIIEIINKIERKDILRFIYIVISDIMKDEKIKKPYRRGVCENYRCPFIIQKPLLSYFE